MIKEIRYKNFKALRDATLPLGRFTLIVGANGTGKTTALKVLNNLEGINSELITNLLSKGLNSEMEFVEIIIDWDEFSVKMNVTSRSVANKLIGINGNVISTSSGPFITILKAFQKFKEAETLESMRVFSFDAEKLSFSTPLDSNLTLQQDGQFLAGVLDQVRDEAPERFEALNRELSIWFPEYDRILFEVPRSGHRSFLLRTKIGKHKIKAKDLSDGTLLALAYLTLAYLPNPPKIVAFEEPEKGIHPRLLQNIQEAMYRLAYPENYGETREPIQVIATTHSPYLLDLYKDHPEEIVIAEKDENGVHFENLAKMKNIDKILRGGESLGEVWFTGVLGGVPAHI